MTHNVYGDRVDSHTGRPIEVNTDDQERAASFVRQTLGLTPVHQMTRPMTGGWWNDHDTVWDVAAYAVDNDLLMARKDVLGFFEKPWNYEELHAEWEAQDD